MKAGMVPLCEVGGVGFVGLCIERAAPFWDIWKRERDPSLVS